MTTNQQKTANLYRVFGTDTGGNVNSLTLANITATGSANLGIIDNVYIGGGANAQILQTDGNGGLSWTNPGGGGGGGIPGGSNTEIQYNNAGSFDGVPMLRYNGSSLSLGAVGGVKITGGSSGQYLQTNGSGDLQWVTGTSANGTGTVTSVNLLAGDGMSVSGGPVTSFGNITVTNTGVTRLTAGTGITLTGNTGNVTITASGGGGGAGTVTAVAGDGSGLGFSLSGLVTSIGNITLAVPTADALKTTLGVASIGNVANLSLNGNASEFLNGAGAFVAVAQPTGNIGNVNLNGNVNQYLNGNGAFANIAVPTGNIANLNLSGNASQYLKGDGTFASLGGVLSNITYGVENVTIIGSASGTYNFDILSGAVRYATFASSNIELNFRGNATTTFTSLLSAGQSITASYVMTTSAAATITGVRIDGNNLAPVYWVNAVSSPAVSNSLMSFTFTIVKVTATNFIVLASATRYSL